MTSINNTPPYEVKPQSANRVREALGISEDVRKEVRTIVEKPKEWEPPAHIMPWIVCAACRSRWDKTIVALGPRHWDPTMRGIAQRMGINDMIDWEQGFVDQWGNFHNRIDAMDIVKQNKQPFNLERNGGQDIELFSEGLY
jgi:hypothetical protein